MRDTVIGLQGSDMAWWCEGEWTPNIFCADKFESNEAVLMVTGFREHGTETYTEHVTVAAKRYYEKTRGEG